MPRRFWQSLLLAVLITLVTVVACVSKTKPAPSFRERYEKLCTWDCLGYADITEKGYFVSDPVTLKTDAVFFPGFPMTSRAISKATGMSSRSTALLTSQIFCILFWLFLLLILESWSVRSEVRVAIVLLILAQPAYFFFTTGYSESFFISSMLGMIYFAQKELRLSGAFGFLTSASRIVGIPLSVYPVLASLTHIRQDLREGARPLATSIVAACGGLSFFLYCGIKFGHPDLYMIAQKNGWGIVPDYYAIFHWLRFQYGTSWDKVSNIALGLALLAWPAIELVMRKPGLGKRLPIYLCALMIEFITLSGLEVRWFYSMIRYTLPGVVLLLLCAGHLSCSLRESDRTARYAVIGVSIAIFCVALPTMSIPHLIDYLEWRWFA